MLVLGLTLQLRTPKPPALRAVLLRDSLLATQTPSLTDITVVETFDLASAEEDWGLLCAYFAEHTASRVSTLNPDRVVVRRADNAPRPSRENGPKLRLLIDGAVTAASHLQVADTLLLNGEECAGACGVDKAILDADGLTLTDKTYAAAAAAALAGITNDRR